jgi:MFS family permease
MTVLAFVFYVTFPLNISMLIAEKGLGDATAAGFSMSLITVVGAALGVVFRPVIKIVKLHMGTLSTLLGLVGLILICFAPNIAVIYVASVLLGVFFGGYAAGTNYIIGRICTKEQIAPTFSILMSLQRVGIVFSPLIINIITGAWGGTGSSGAFTTTTVGMAVIFIIQIFWNIYLTKAFPETENG